MALEVEKRPKKKPNGQIYFSRPRKKIKSQIPVIWPRKGQTGNPAFQYFIFTLLHLRNSVLERDRLG